MKSITTLENIPDSLDIQEMMDVKGGAEARAICFFAAAVKCNLVRLLHRSQIQIQLHLQSPDVKALTM